MHKPALQYFAGSSMDYNKAWIRAHGAMQIQGDTVFKALENDVNVSFT